MLTLILLNSQVYQAPESVIMNHRVQHFHELRPYFYLIKADHSWLLTLDHICKNKKPCLYVHKETNTKLSRPSNPSLDKWKCTSFIFVFYPLSFTSWRYPNTAVAVKGHYKCRCFDVHKSFVFTSQGHKDFEHNFVYSKAIQITGK